MKQLHTIAQCKQWIEAAKTSGQTIGFVPTMGYLHEGHLALVNAAKQENDLVIMSIFVNPTQFGPGEDYDVYPRDENRDLALAKKVGVDVVFTPTIDEMYPKETTIQIVPGAQKNVLCGKSRPTHFDGVLQVILKLFNIVTPTTAYFGMKDAQQLAIIETFMEAFNFSTTIRRVPTIREEDGLAKSSRNVHLTEIERLEAPAIYKALQSGQALFRKTKNTAQTIETVRQQIETHTSGKIDYVELLAYPQLTPIDAHTTEVIIATAVHFAHTRLIDNIILQIEDEEHVSNDDE